MSTRARKTAFYEDQEYCETTLDNVPLVDLVHTASLEPGGVDFHGRGFDAMACGNSISGEVGGILNELDGARLLGGLIDIAGGPSPRIMNR